MQQQCFLRFDTLAEQLPRTASRKTCARSILRNLSLLFFFQNGLLHKKNNCLNSTTVRKISDLLTSRQKKCQCYQYFLTLILLISPKGITQGLKNHPQVFSVSIHPRKGKLLFVTLHICYLHPKSFKYFKEYMLKLYAYK